MIKLTKDSEYIDGHGDKITIVAVNPVHSNLFVGVDPDSHLSNYFSDGVISWGRNDPTENKNNLVSLYTPPRQAKEVVADLVDIARHVGNKEMRKWNIDGCDNIHKLIEEAEGLEI